MSGQGTASAGALIPIQNGSLAALPQIGEGGILCTTGQPQPRAGGMLHCGS